jgi:alanine racemase
MGAVEAEAVEIFKRVAALPQIHVHSISTHMPVSDVDPEYTKEQLGRFSKSCSGNPSRSSRNLQSACLTKRGNARV